MKIGCVLMAAGSSSRFGENKLFYPLEGRTLLARALAAAPAHLFARAVAVVSNPMVEAAVRETGYTPIVNPDAPRGQGTTVSLGIRALEGMDAAMFLVADQPYLSRESVERMLAAYRPGMILALSYRGRRGNPVLFPSELFSELASVSPEETGKAVIVRHPERLELIEAGSGRELLDIDAKTDLNA